MILLKQNPWRFFTSKNLQRGFTIAVLAAFAMIIGVFALNHFRLQRPLKKVVGQDARNQGVHAKAYYDSYFNTGTIVFDVRNVGAPAGAADVVRSFIAFAHELQGRDIDEVVIAWRGNRKVKIDGDDFLSLGASVGTTTPRKLLWELAHDLRYLNGKQVVANLPGNYAKLLQTALGDGNEEAAATQLLGAFSQ
ncbi:MAG: hypothetical protein P9L99_19715 [Candidatus Lernaella stagnicola]|nr:hypothetical protein [Candidatus Lernaella stagnicola]